MRNSVVNWKRSLLLNLFLLQLLLAVNDDFLSDIMTFYLIQQLNSHICQKGLLFMHHLHCLQSRGLCHQYRQKSLNLHFELSPQNLMNLAFFMSTKPIPPWYLMRTKVLTTTAMLLDSRVLLVLVLDTGGPGLDAKFRTFGLICFTRISSHHFLMLQSFSS